MFGSFDWQFATGVKVDDLGHAVKQAAVLAQYVLIIFGPRQLHMHETLTAPGKGERGNGDKGGEVLNDRREQLKEEKQRARQRG